MKLYLENSFIFQSLLKLRLFLKSKIKDSFIFLLLQKVGKSFNKLLSGSLLWSYFQKEDSLDSLFENSLTKRFFHFIINLPIYLGNSIYKFTEKYLSNSLFFKLFEKLSDNIVYVIGIIVCLVIVIPNHLWSNFYFLVFLGLLWILHLIKFIKYGEKYIEKSKLDISFFIFLLLIIISALTSISFSNSLSDLIFYLLVLISMIIITSNIRNQKDIDIITNFIIIGVILSALYGFYQWKIVGIAINPSLTDISINKDLGGRVYSTMGNPNVYGELLVLTMPFFISKFLNLKNWKGKSLVLLSYLFTLIILLKTGSRSAWVSFAFGLFIFIFLKNIKLLPPVLLIAIMMVPFLPESIYNRLLTIANPNDSSLRYRRLILEPTVPMLRKYWITGVGLGSSTFNIIYKRYKGFRLKTVAHTHNLFLQVWLESGILALLVLLWLGFRLIKKTIYIKNNSKNQNTINTSIAALSSIGGLMLMGFADHVWFYNRIVFIFWLLASIVFVNYNLTLGENN